MSLYCCCRGPKFDSLLPCGEAYNYDSSSMGIQCLWSQRAPELMNTYSASSTYTYIKQNKPQKKKKKPKEQGSWAPFSHPLVVYICLYNSQCWEGGGVERNWELLHHSGTLMRWSSTLGTHENAPGEGAREDGSVSKSTCPEKLDLSSNTWHLH